MNPAFFIVGCTRSGTTLLQRLLDAHPDVAVVNESHWILLPFRDRPALPVDAGPTAEIVALVTAHPKFRKLKVDVAEVERLLEEEPPATYRDLVTRLFDLHADKKGKELAGDKTPSFVRNLPLLHRLWPDARFLHLIRDGRDVTLSTLNWKKAEAIVGRRFSSWTLDPLTTTALRWEWSVRLGREAGRALGPRLYHEVRYEELVGDPASAVADICSWLGLTVDDAMLRFHEGRTRSDPALGSKRAWLPVTPGVRDWSTQMERHEVERFEAAAGQLLEELDYRRGCEEPSPESLAGVARLRQTFSAEVLAWGYSLPESW